MKQQFLFRSLTGLALLTASTFAIGARDPEEIRMHKAICARIKAARAAVDLETCQSTGKVVLGAYDSEEAVYQLQGARLFTQKNTEYFCFATAGEAGLLFEGCQAQK